MVQGIYNFPGINHPKKGVYSQSYGTEPDRISLEFTFQNANIAAGGTVTFSYGGTDISLPDCKVDQGDFEFDDNGRIEKVILFDRRWRWRLVPKVSFHFNEYLASGIREVTERTPQEILSYLFNLIGESSVDLSAIPNTSKPEMFAKCKAPVDLIDDLVDLIGCRVILGYGSDPVSVVPINHGDALPDDQTVNRVSVSWNPPEVPAAIQIRFSETIYQSRFLTEPVGMDTVDRDSEILPIDDLSYEPNFTWRKVADIDGFNDLDGEDAQNARQTVYRWYRIVDGPYEIPGYSDPVSGSSSVEERFQVLPLRRSGVEQVRTEGQPQFVPAKIWGEVYVEDAFDNSFPTPASGMNTTRELDLPIDFSIDQVNGIVKFKRPIIKRDGIENGDPGIVLEVAHSIRNENTWETDSYERTVDINGGGTGTVTICIPVSRVVINSYTEDHEPSDFQDNVDQLNAMADSIAADYASRLAAYESYIVTYNRLRTDIKPTGKIAQVTTVVDDTMGATTVAGQHVEWDLGAKTYVEKRRIRANEASGVAIREIETVRAKETFRGR